MERHVIHANDDMCMLDVNELHHIGIKLGRYNYYNMVEKC